MERLQGEPQRYDFSVGMDDVIASNMEEWMLAHGSR